MPKNQEGTKNVYQSSRPESKGGRSVNVGRSRSARAFSWAECDAGELWAFIAHVASSGDLACITATSDGGAASITIVAGGTRFKSYASDPDELLERLRDLRTEIYGD